MIGLFSRSLRKAPMSRADSFRPTLEKLETRDCPSTIMLLTPYVAASSKEIAIYGQVTNTPSPGGLSVLLSGVVDGTTTTDSNGYFHYDATASGQGIVYAATGDGQSNIAQAAVTDLGTTINDFMGICEPNHVWLFSGQVSGGYTGQVVNFSGLHSLEGGSAKVDSSGNFNYAVQLDGKMDDVGDAYAQTTDVWGMQSNEASYWVV